MNNKDIESDTAWVVGFDAYDPDDEKRREAILALGNGVVASRACAADASMSDRHYPGTYMAGCYEWLVSELPVGIDETESLANLPNWLPLTFRTDDGHWFSIDDVELADYRHELHLNTGIGLRKFTFTNVAGQRFRFSERRLISMDNPHLAAIQLRITAVNLSGKLEIYSAIDGAVINANVPRYQDYEARHIEVASCGAFADDTLFMTARTRRSDLQIAEVIQTAVSGVAQASFVVSEDPSCVANRIFCQVSAGQTLVVEKLLALSTSEDPSREPPLPVAQRALTDAKSFADMQAAHQRSWSMLWQRAVIESDCPSTTRALRFHAFHILQSISPHSTKLDVGVPARGWHGEVYRGQVFWDELFVLPFLNFRFPDAARSVLLYRYRRLDQAKAAASDAGCRGAMFPWRSAKTGEEVTPKFQKNMVSGHWMQDPTRLQRHVGLAIAFNVWQYYLATSDREFLASHGAELILEIARFFGSIAEYSSDKDRFEIRGMIGPDEYHNSYSDQASPGLNNNAYTNVMAVWTLRLALDVLSHLPDQTAEGLVQRIGLTDTELQLWDSISRKMYVPFHEETPGGSRVISQFEGFETLREFDGQELPPELKGVRTDWALEALGETADAYQITKQADALALLYLLPQKEITALLQRLGYGLDGADLQRTADYYLARTTHRSSLSRIVYAGALAEIDLGRSWHLYHQALDADLKSLQSESIAEGIHLGAMGGTLDVLQRHYLGVKATLSALELNPALPPELGTIKTNLLYHGQELDVQAAGPEFTIRSAPQNRSSVSVSGWGKRQVLRPGEALTMQAPTEPAESKAAVGTDSEA